MSAQYVKYLRSDKYIQHCAQDACVCLLPIYLDSLRLQSRKEVESQVNHVIDFQIQENEVWNVN